MRFRNFDEARIMTRYDTLHMVFPKFCGFIGCRDENHGSALKCDQETDVHSILKMVRWHYDGDIQKKEDTWEL